jgi:hypothetical protein
VALIHFMPPFLMKAAHREPSDVTSEGNPRYRMRAETHDFWQR